MPDDKAATLSATDFDEDARKLWVDAQTAKYIETIAKAGQGTAEAKAGALKAVSPSITDAPKGEVTLGEKAGAFGPWRAHQVIYGSAKKIAEQVSALLADTSDPRVLVVDDRPLLQDDWTARNVASTLTRLSRRMQALRHDIDRGLQDLGEAIASYEAQETAQAAAAGERQPSRRRGGDLGAVQETAAGEAAGPAAAGGVPAGALGAAVGLLGLLRTDYTITATTVSAVPTELATLTAAQLAKQHRAQKPGADGAPRKVTVEADDFSTMRPSSSTDRFAAILEVRDSAVQALSALQARLAPVEAELTSINARFTAVEQAWTTAIAGNKEPAATMALRSEVRELAEQASRREKAAGPARVVVTQAQQVITDADAAATALLQAPEGDEAPLLTTVRRERLDAAVGSEKITHVLYVKLDVVASDAVTRRSILGTSGRIRFLSAGNASWLLLETSSGTIAGGGQVSLADVMTFSLENGTARFKKDGEWLETTSDPANDDPLDTLETWAKGLIVALVFVLIVLGVLSVLAVIRIAFG